MAADQHSVSQQGKRHRSHGGAKNHVLAFGLSIFLTVLAFAAVAYGEMDRGFILLFIVTLAIAQVIIQLAFWMHMKDKGHKYATIGIIMGAVVALTAFASAIYWSWW